MSRSRPPLSSLAGHSDFNRSFNQSSLQSPPPSLHTFSHHEEDEKETRYVPSTSSIYETGYPSTITSPTSTSSNPPSSFQRSLLSHPSPIRRLATVSRKQDPNAPNSSTTNSALYYHNTTAHDRRLRTKQARLDAIGRSRHFGLVGKSNGGRRQYFWRSPFVRKEKRVRMLLVQHPSVYPVLSRHLAARMIQHWWHRFTPEQRCKRSRARQEAALALGAQGQMWKHPYAVWQEATKEAIRRAVARKRLTKTSLTSRYFLETGLYAMQLGTGLGTTAPKPYTSAFKDWCASKIARNWLHYHTARRYRMYTIRPVYIYAAIDIQRCFREYLRKKKERGDPLQQLHPPARIIQRAYKRFTQRRIYQYFRDLIFSRQNSNPYLLLKLLNPREASQNGDHSSGLYLRFRLGGNVFPPILYYKIFTNFNVTDIGSFAPRDYARDRKMEREKVHVVDEPGDARHPSQHNPTDRAYWYKRYENNGWRPIVSDVLQLERDPVCEATSATKVTFHPNKLVRRLDALKKRKGKKIEWLKKLYSSGVIALPTAEQLAAAKSGLDPAEEKQQSSAMDSDEEEWNAWKSASAAKLPTATSSSPQRSPSDVLAALSAIDTTNAREVLNGTWEEEAADLIDWAANLGAGDFEAYKDEWMVTATTRPNDKEYRRWDHVATTTEIHNLNASTNTQIPIVESGSNRSSKPSQRTSQVSLNLQQQQHQDSQRSITLAPSVSVSARELPSYQVVQSGTNSILAPSAEAAAMLRETAAENEGLPEWIAQTASRAQLASLAASQKETMGQQEAQEAVVQPSISSRRHSSRTSSQQTLATTTTIPTSFVGGPNSTRRMSPVASQAAAYSLDASQNLSLTPAVVTTTGNTKRLSGLRQQSHG